MAWCAQIYITPESMIPIIGASGAIGGLLGTYFLLFPLSEITFLVPPLVFIAFELPAWVLISAWVILQFLFENSNVAYWVHIGGFAAGIFTVIGLGGRDNILKGYNIKYEM